MATLARLDIVVGANTAQFATGMNATKRHLDGVASSAQAARTKMYDLGSVAKAVFGAVMVREVGRAAGAIFSIGSSVEETQSKFNTVLGDQAGRMSQFIETFGRAAGLSRREGQDMVATAAAIAQGFGFAHKASIDYAEQVIRMSADIASFNNVAGGTAEVVMAINAAAAGEREQMKKWGIVIREVEVQQRAMAESGKRSATALTQSEKAAATAALIYEKAGVAMGDLDRTQLSAANTARRVGARLKDIRDEAASALLPVMGQLLGALDQNASAFDAVSEAIGQTGRFINTGIAQVQLLAVEFAVVQAKVGVWGAHVKDAVANALLASGVAGIIVQFSDFIHGLPPWLQFLLGLPGPVNPIDMAHGLADLVQSDTELAVKHAEANLKRIVEAAEDTRNEILTALNSALGISGVLPSVRSGGGGGEDESAANQVLKVVQKVKAELAEVEAMAGIADPLDLLKERASIAERAVRSLAAAGLANTEEFRQYREELEHLTESLEFFEQFNKEWEAWEKQQAKAAKVLSDLEEATRGFADDFITRISRVTTDGAAAFKGFADSVIQELTRIAVKLAVLEFLGAVAPAGTAAKLGLAPAAPAGATTASGGAVSGLKLGGGVVPVAGASLRQDITLNFNSLDPRTHQALLREQSSTLVDILVQAGMGTMYTHNLLSNGGT